MFDAPLLTRPVGDQVGVVRSMGVGANYASQYRRRLIAADLIYPAGHGRVDYTLPHLREYLREHTVSADSDPTSLPVRGCRRHCGGVVLVLREPKTPVMAETETEPEPPVSPAPTQARVR
jgi:hypothetical protein